jgi:hypothetical protein
MLGLLLIYFVGKVFYNLAEEYNRHLWGFAIAGVVSYYVGTFLFSIAMVLYYDYYSSEGFDSLDELSLNLMAIPFGLLTCWFFYKLLERNWSKTLIHEDDRNILDENF